MPTEAERTELLDALIENAFRYLKRSIGGIAEDQQLAIADFTVAMELLLKAVLMREHWALVTEHPHAATWDKFRAGDVPTLGGTKLLGAIPNITGVQIPPALSQLLKHRNRMLHFTSMGDISAVAAEMWRVWHEMHRLMNRQWQATFSEHMWQIAEAEQLFAQFTQYLQVRFDALDPKLKADPNLMECDICSFKSARRGSESSRLVSSGCLVCYEHSNLTLCDKCGEWVRRNYDDPLCPKCTHVISLDGIAEELKDPLPNLKPKDLATQPRPPSCPMCQNETSYWRSHWICVPCNEEYTVSHDCEQCAHHWAGNRKPDELQCAFCSGFGVSAFGSSPLGSG